MEPFHMRQDTSIPYFSLKEWEEKFPHLVVGMSARDIHSQEDPDRWNYALHVGEDPGRVVQNREQLLSQLRFPVSSWTCANQVHGTHVHVVNQSERGRGKESQETAIPATDGLITGEEDVLLSSFYADCVPLLFYSPEADIVGVAHAGWRGTVGEIGRRMVEAMESKGASAETILAAIAPSIGGCCYEVDEKVAHPLLEVLPDASSEVLRPVQPGKWKLDLRQANRQLLLRAGLQPENILVTKWCTSCHPELFHSHRRDKGKTGRMAAFIGKRKGRGRHG
jgi:polyphenol oxidase